MNANMQEKALIVLKVCAMPAAADRTVNLDWIGFTYGDKVIKRKLELLRRRGYVDTEGSITAKGRAALVAHGRTV